MFAMKAMRWFGVLRRRPRAAATLSVIALAAAVSAVLHPAMREAAARAAARHGWAVQNVVVVGRARTEPRDLLEALESPIGAPIFALDLSAARTRIEALPWVRRAAISRRWPNRIEVRLQERRAVAILEEGGRRRLVDGGGVVIQATPTTADHSLLRIEGPQAAEAAAELAVALKERPDLAASTQIARRVGGRRWDLVLHDGLIVKLPETGVASALAWLSEERREGRARASTLALIDLRYDDHVVVRPRAPTPNSERDA